jgi:glutamate dehydrogenase (NADP+)
MVLTNGYVDYVKGANIAGFVKVADAMLARWCKNF